MKRKLLVAVSVGVLMTAVLVVVLWIKKDPTGDSIHAFDWNVIERMIASGVSSNERYSVEAVELRHVPMPSAKVFFVVDRQFEALLGPKQTLLVYYPDSKIFVHEHDHLKGILGTRQYKAESTDELLTLASEVVPLLYGCSPTQHEVVTKSDLVGSGRLPITKDTILVRGTPVGLFANYYARLGPWGDIVSVVAVLQGKKLRIVIHLIYQTPRVYE